MTTEMSALESAYGFRVVDELEKLNRYYPCPQLPRAITYIKHLQETRLQDGLRINELQTKVREYEAAQAALRG